MVGGARAVCPPNPPAGIIGGMSPHAKLLKDLVIKDLQARYRTSVMGFFWSVINPLIMVGLFTFLFSLLLNVKPPAGIRSFALYVFSGVLPWFTVQEALYRSTNSILENSSLVKTIKFPASILPLYLVISGIVNESIGLVVLVPLAAYSQGELTPVFLLIIPILVLQAMFCLGLGWILATLQVYVRDTMQLLGVVLMVWMYLTPIFYPPEAMPPAYSMLLQANPLHHLLLIYRSVLVEFELPQPRAVLFFATASLAVFYWGYGVIRRRGRSFADLV